MHYNQLVTGKNKKISYNFFYELFAFDGEKDGKHLYQNPNRYPSFFYHLIKI
jgi:hypothetical protein